MAFCDAPLHQKGGRAGDEGRGKGCAGGFGVGSAGSSGQDSDAGGGKDGLLAEIAGVTAAGEIGVSKRAAVVGADGCDTAGCRWNREGGVCRWV